ncbi:MAG: Wzz/FepE/Etk N-terminal domain-containing protein [Chloroflexota bacterium]
MEFQQVLRTLKAGWWIVLAALLISLGLGLALSYAQTPIYEAEASFVASPSTATLTDTGDFLQQLDTLARRTGLVATYCAILQSQNIFETASLSLGLPAATLAEQYSLTCVVLPDTSVLELRLRGPSPEISLALIEAIGAAGIEYISALYEIYELRNLDAAVVTPQPVSPNHVIDVALSAVMGVMGGVGFIFLRQALLRPFSGQQPSVLDPATGVANWFYLRQRVDEEIGRARLQNYPLSLAFIAFSPTEDLSHYPAAVIQQLRRQLAVFLQDNARPLDLVAYVQDDTFALLMPEANGLEARDWLADLMGLLRSDVFALHDLRISVAYQAFAGVVENSGGTADWRGLFKLCQEALAAAESDGPYQVHLERASPGPFYEVLLAEG